MGMSLLSFSLILVVISLLIGQNVAVRIDITPSVAIEDIENEVKISCLPTGVHSASHKSVVFEIEKDGQPILMMREGSRLLYGKQSARFKVDGHIDQQVNESRVILTINNPKQEDSGQYLCTLYYLDAVSLIFKEEKNAGNLTIEAFDIPRLLKRLLGEVSDLKGVAKELITKDVELEKQTGDLTKEMKDVSDKVNYMTAFSACLSTDITPSVGSTIVFSKVIMKKGVGYNESTGIFTAPRAGLYAFHLAITTGEAGHWATIDLYDNTNILIRLGVGDNHRYVQSSVSSVVELNPGDQVKAVVSALQAAKSLRRDKDSVFSGYMVHPL